MKKIEFNEENLKQCEIDRTVNKVRGLIFNKKGGKEYVNFSYRWCRLYRKPHKC